MMVAKSDLTLMTLSMTFANAEGTATGGRREEIHSASGTKSLMATVYLCVGPDASAACSRAASFRALPFKRPDFGGSGGE